MASYDYKRCGRGHIHKVRTTCATCAQEDRAKAEFQGNTTVGRVLDTTYVRRGIVAVRIALSSGTERTIEVDSDTWDPDTRHDPAPPKVGEIVTLDTSLKPAWLVRKGT